MLSLDLLRFTFERNNVCIFKSLFFVCLYLAESRVFYVALKAIKANELEMRQAGARLRAHIQEEARKLEEPVGRDKL